MGPIPPSNPPLTSIKAPPKDFLVTILQTDLKIPMVSENVLSYIPSTELVFDVDVSGLSFYQYTPSIAVLV